MRLLIISDCRGWAYDHISNGIKKFNQDDSIDISIIYLNENAVQIAKDTWEEYDVILMMGWYLYQYFEFIPQNKVIAGIHSFDQWGKRLILPHQKFIDHLNGFDRINVISERFFNVFSRLGIHNIYYTPNGVDCEAFCPKTKMPDKFTIGVVAKSFRWKLKRINEFFIPAAKKSQVDYKILTGGADIISHKDMPDFYNSINCYVCASKSEGFSTSALEAGSCGRPLISTNISGTEELVVSEQTGFITDFSVDSVSDKIEFLRNDVEKCKCMGDNMRKHIVENYSWQKVVPYWISFFKGEK